MTFESKNLSVAILAIETNGAQALEAHNPYLEWSLVYGQLKTLLSMMPGQDLKTHCNIFQEAYLNYKKLERQWGQEGASAQEQEYLLGYFVRFYEVSLTCQLIRQAKTSEKYDAEAVWYYKKILQSKSVTEELSLKGSTEEDAAFCKMRIEVLKTLDQFYEPKEIMTRAERWSHVREAFQRFDPEEAKFSPKEHLTSDDVMTASSHLALASIQQLHERPWCPVFKKVTVMLRRRLDQLAATEEEKMDLWMYAVRCYEMLMVRQMVMEAVEARPYTKYEETLSVFNEIMALGSFKEKFASKGWDEGSTGFYEKRQEFEDLLQAAKTRERGEIHDHFREFYLRFSNLDTRPGRQDFVMHGSLTASTDEYPESVRNSLWNVFQETVPHLTSFTGASGPTATSGSGASGAGNRT